MLWAARGWFVAISAACLLSSGALAGQHYERPPCGHDEVQGEVLGLSGYTCSPRCAEATFDCPTDVPDLANARPQCMLKDVDGGAFCGLLCSGDYQCPNGARCQHLQQAGVGVCMYPLSFTDWVRQGSSRRLSFGLPQRTDRKLPPAVVQKAVDAVQNLKSKFFIPDGDTDILTVKEFLSGLGGAAPSSGDGVLSAYPSGSSGISPAAAAPQPRQEGSTFGAYRHDFAYARDRLSEGLPGLEKEIGGIIHKVEHLEDRGNASALMRGILEIAVLYLLIGSIYKYQALGARGIDMIPHIGFWLEYPQLVNDGIIYSKQLVGGFLGIDVGSASFGDSFGGGGGGFEPLGRKDRDTFANFEPSQL